MSEPRPGAVNVLEMLEKCAAAKPSHSIAMEDALSGIPSGRMAGFKIISMQHEAECGWSDFSAAAAFAMFLA